MKRSMKKLGLNRETVHTLSVGGATDSTSSDYYGGGGNNMSTSSNTGWGGSWGK